MGTKAHTVPRFYLDGFVDTAVPPGQEPWVWIGDVKTGDIVRRSPRNVSIARGFYDGPGGLVDRNQTIEKKLSEIESDAAFALREFVATPPQSRAGIPPAIGRFLAWQAARTPAMLQLFQKWSDAMPDLDEALFVEPPPEGFEAITSVERTITMKNLLTGEVKEVPSNNVVETLRGAGWRISLRRDDFLELAHLQAWYFQVRFFPRFNWVVLDAPAAEWFVTSDRAVAWKCKGATDAMPRALRDPSAMIIAPLTRSVVLVGKNSPFDTSARITPGAVNGTVAALASSWIAGPSRESVETALAARNRFESS